MNLTGQDKIFNITTTQQPSSLKSNDDSSGEGVKYFFFFYYTAVFLAGLIGNIIIIASVIKFQRMRTVVNIFLVNLAIADLMFVILSLFDGVTFTYGGEWVFGDILCRVQSTLIELSYTVSVCTLTVVAAERYMSICHPHRLKRTLSQAVKVCLFVWIFSILFCGCLFYGYATRINDDGVDGCFNDNWSHKSRLSFYTVHSVLVYLIPLGMMCFSHVMISKALVRQKMRTFSTFTISSDQIASNMEDNTTTDVNRNSSSNSVKVNPAVTKQKEAKRRVKRATRRSKVIRLLIVVTVIFFILWTPFIVVRLLLYFNMQVNDMLWRGTQLLIFGNTAVNCFIYALMSPAFRQAFKGLFYCRSSLQKKFTMGSASRSFDLSETLRKQSIINRKATLN